MSAVVPIRAKTKSSKPAQKALKPAKPARAAPDPRWKLSPEQKLWYLKHEVPKKDWGLPSGRVILFAHMLVVPAGRHIGKPLRLREFQLQFLRDVYNPRTAHGLRKRRQAIMSVGRRAGKTLLAALMVLVHLIGPEARRNSVIVSAATTRKQAGIVYRLCAQMTRASAMLRTKLKLIESTKSIVRVEDLSSYHALSAEAGGAFGEGIDFCVYDELAQAQSTALYDALQTSLGSQVEPLMVVISTQAPSSSHLLSELIDYGLKIQAGEFEDDSFTVHLYAADDGCDLMDRKQWKKANPTLGDYRSMEEFESTMARAARVPSLEASVRNLYLNTRTQAVAPFLTASTWSLGDAPIDQSLFYSGRPVYGGLDLSARTDLCAFVLAVMDDDGAVHLMPRIFTPDDTLDDRALVDRAPYRVWADRNFLIPVPGTAIDYDFVAQDVGDQAGKMPLQRMAYDRWRIDVFKLSMQRLGIQVELMPFGQGFKDMAPAVDTFEELALQGKLRHGQHPVLRWAVSNSVVDRDPAGNRKLTKMKSFGRIDPAVAAIMAVAAMKLQTELAVDVTTLVF
jgi:phage terminase large subunit-like protein